MLKLLSLFLVAISLNLGLINAQTTTASNCGYGYYKNGAVCTICPAGYSCNGLTKTACPLGTSTNNATGAGQCTDCMQDTYAPTVGSKVLKNLFYKFINLIHKFPYHKKSISSFV